MFLLQDINLLKQELSKYCDNYVEAIVGKTGLTYPTVHKFFRGEKIRPSNARNIYETGVDLIEALKSQKLSLIERARELATEPLRAAGS